MSAPSSPKWPSMKPEGSANCPFCSGTYSLSRDCDGKGTPGAFHTLPSCQRFLDLDPLDFAVAARKAQGAS